MPNAHLQKEVYTPEFVRQDLTILLDLLQQQKIKPLIARRFPLAEARDAHELLGQGGVTGKIVLVLDGPPPSRLPPWDRKAMLCR